MTVEQMIEAARRIRRASTFNPKTMTLKTFGKVVPAIPCYRCGGIGQVKLGNDAFAGMGRCGVCQGRKRLTAADVKRNIDWAAARQQQAVEDVDPIFAEFAKLEKAAGASAGE